MEWSLGILVAVSAAAGVALGRIISRQLRQRLLIAGTEAAILGAALPWVTALGPELALDAGTATVFTLGLFAVAAVLLAFGLGAAVTGP